MSRTKLNPGNFGTVLNLILGLRGDVWDYYFKFSLRIYIPWLRLCKVVREKLGVGTILGLTATAPERTIASVAEQLGVPGEGVIRGPLLPTNLRLSVSKVGSR